MSAPTANGHLHHALFFDTGDQLLGAAVPFLRAGLAEGETAALACTDDNNHRLADALGGDSRIVLIRQADIYTRVPAAIASHQRLVRTELANGAPRVRLVSEVDFGSDPSSLAEWSRFEAVLNVALGSHPLSTVCAYDTESLPRAALDAGRRTHPHLLTDSGRVANDDYVEPLDFRRGLDVIDDEIRSTPPTMRLPDLFEDSNVAPLRRALRSTLSGVTAPLTRSDFVTAVAEVAANAVTHGRPPVRVRLWVAPDRLLCAVTDLGEGFDEPLAGYLPLGDGPGPSGPEQSGAGLWLARHLCDRIEMTPADDGFTVWLTTARPHALPAPTDTTDTWARARAARLRAARLVRAHLAPDG